MTLLKNPRIRSTRIGTLRRGLGELKGAHELAPLLLSLFHGRSLCALRISDATKQTRSSKALSGPAFSPLEDFLAFEHRQIGVVQPGPARGMDLQTGS